MVTEQINSLRQEREASVIGGLLLGGLTLTRKMFSPHLILKCSRSRFINVRLKLSGRKPETEILSTRYWLAMRLAMKTLYR